METKATGVVEQVTENVWRIDGNSNIYVLYLDSGLVVIDTGRRENRGIIEEAFKEVADVLKVEKVIFTHLHYDHIGNFDLFPNATFYASKEEIDDFNINPIQTVLNNDLASEFDSELEDVKNLRIPELHVIKTPGHTLGSISIYYPEKNILFSGDTLFKNRRGNTHFPTSSPAQMPHSLNKLKELGYEILCPGHEYGEED